MLCISAFQRHCQTATESEKGRGNDHLDSSPMADTTLVRGSTPTATTASFGDKGNTTHFTPGPQTTGRPPAGRETDPVGLSYLRKYYEDQGFTKSVADIMTNSKRPSTHKQYHTYLTQWFAYCSTTGINPTTPSVQQTLAFIDKIR